MTTSADFDRLVPAIYEAASAPDGWADVLSGIAKSLGADSAMIGLVPADCMWNGEIWGANLDRASIANFLSPGSVDNSVFVRALQLLPIGHSVDLRMNGLAAVQADPGAQQLLLPQDLTQGQFAPVLRNGNAISGLAILNEGRRGPLDPIAVAMLDAMLPRLSHAMAIHMRLARLRGVAKTLSDSLQRLTVGVLVVTATLRLRFANAEAERILATADGICLRNGRIGLSDNAIHSALRVSLAGLVSCRADNAPACLFVPRPSGAPSYTLVIAPAGAIAASAGQRAAATLFVTDPVGPSALPGPELLADGLGLTATEAEVARLAAIGRGMTFVAESLGVSLNTARTHLKAVYGKTGVNHQAALARIIADRFPPVRGLNAEKDADARR